jgi:rhodanese-related sulfurtransferase
MRILSRIAISIFILLISNAGIANNTSTTIDIEKAKELWDSGVLFVDSRSASNYNSGHIPGAINIDVRKNFEAEFSNQVSKDQEVVIYCSGRGCTRSISAINIATSLGYQKLYRFKDGIAGWTFANLPTKKSQQTETNSDGFTPLHAAAESGQHETALLLIGKGVDVNAKTTGGSNPGETPLHVAASLGHFEVVNLLIKNGADVNSVNDKSHTPLRQAADRRNTKIIKLLIENGADINAQGKYGITVLHVVAQSYDVSLAEYLLSKGADVNAKDKVSKFTPLDFALDGEPEMIQLFKQNGGECTSC